jgi:hypothetical protein
MNKNKSEELLKGTVPFNPNPLPVPDVCFTFVLSKYAEILARFEEYANLYWELFERHLDYDFRHMGLALPYEKKGGCNE